MRNIGGRITPGIAGGVDRSSVNDSARFRANSCLTGELPCRHFDGPPGAYRRKISRLRNRRSSTSSRSSRTPLGKYGFQLLMTNGRHAFGTRRHALTGSLARRVHDLPQRCRSGHLPLGGERHPDRRRAQFSSVRCAGRRESSSKRFSPLPATPSQSRARIVADWEQCARSPSTSSLRTLSVRRDRCGMTTHAGRSGCTSSSWERSRQSTP
jgi:hypothetical protein